MKRQVFKKDKDVTSSVKHTATVANLAKNCLARFQKLKILFSKKFSEFLKNVTKYGKLKVRLVKVVSDF